jgi:hypothetical protein
VASDIAPELDGLESVRVPVRCPRCGQVSLCEYPAVVVVTALTKWNNMNLYVACHPGSWDASEEDLSMIREVIGTDWLNERSTKNPVQ